MKVTFNERSLEELYETPLDSIGKQPFSKEVIKHYQKKIDLLKYANNLGDIARFKGLNFEKLNGKKYKDCNSIRVNEQYRIIFRSLGKGKIEVLILELSKHYE